MSEAAIPIGESDWDPKRLASQDPARYEQLRATFKDLLPPTEALFRNRGELDVARYFVEECGDRLRYCANAGGWYVWDGRRWAIDANGAVERLAKERIDRIADFASAESDMKERLERLRFAIGLRKRRAIENVIALARSEAGISIGDPSSFDADPWLLNVQNGIVDLRTGDLALHDPDKLMTRLAPVAFDREAPCARWLRFLEEVFAGDSDTIDFVQRAAGYSLTGDAREQCFFILHGAGANGKTTFLSTLSSAIGAYALSTKPETFVDRQAGAATNDLARLHGARFVSSIEMSEGRALAEGFVKAVTGGDRISARYLYGEYFDFEPAFKLWLGTNHKPDIKGADEGIWRRVRLIPFERRFQGSNCDPDLRAKLNEELPGILAWAVRGGLKWQESGLHAPQAVAMATATYRTEMDVLAAFIDERCLLERHAQAAAGQLYTAYRQWADANGENPLTQTWFGRRLDDRGLTKGRDNRGRVIRKGIGVRDEA